MSADKPSGRPPGWAAITPRLVAKDAAGLVTFLKYVFAATGDAQQDAPSILQIEECRLMISEAGPRPSSPAFLYVYVADVDSTFKRAVECRARVLEAPLMTPYGDRRCMFEDLWANTWQVATYQGAP